MSYLRPIGKIDPIRFKILVSLVTVGAVVLSLLGAVGASANPSIDEKRAQAQAILDQVQQLDGEVGDAAERWNGANYRLAQIKENLGFAERDLSRTRAAVKVSETNISARLRELYINGQPPSAVEVLLGAESLTQIVDLLDTTNRIKLQDNRIAEELATYRARAARREQQLRAARAQQTAVVRQRAAEKVAIEAKLVERRRLLSSVRAEVQRLVAEERVRQAELRRQAEIRLARQRAAARAERQQAAEQALGTVESSGAAFVPPADASRGAQVVAIAMQYLGINYVWGAASPASGFDCSGLTMYVFNQVGVSLPHHAAAQYTLGADVPRDQLQPGDLVFFHGLGHMGMYIGGDSFIHAPHTGDVVKISSLSESYYTSTWVGAKRVL